MKTAKDANIPYKVYLSENEMPQAWYNLRADMKNKPAPLLNPGTHQPMTAEELSGVFCAELVAWRQLLHGSLLCQAGLPGGEQASAIAKARSGAELAGAMDELAKACDYAQSNVGVGHLCGALRTLK